MDFYIDTGFFLAGGPEPAADKAEQLCGSEAELLTRWSSGSSSSLCNGVRNLQQLMLHRFVVQTLKNLDLSYKKKRRVCVFQASSTK